MTPGIPDLGAFMPPSPIDGRRRFVWCEVKAKGGRLRPEQAVFQGHCQLAGVDHVVGGLDEVYAYLLSLGYVLEPGVPHYRRTA